jgi:hypothetical protein
MAVATGWWNPRPFAANAKFHYVGEDGRTLCGKWAYMGLGEVEEGQDDHKDNCAECKRRKAKLSA